MFLHNHNIIESKVITTTSKILEKKFISEI